MAASASSSPATTSGSTTARRSRSSSCECDLLVTEATFGLPVFQHPDPMAEIGRLLKSVREHPERAHVIGCYALGKAQRVISLLRQAGYDEPIYLHGAMIALCDLYEERGIPLGPLVHSLEKTKAELAGQDRHRAAGRDQGPLVAAAARPGARGRLGLDERQAAGAAVGRRAAAGHLRPCRLERAAPDHRRHRGRDGVGHPRPRGCAGLPLPAAGARRPSRSASRPTKKTRRRREEVRGTPRAPRAHALAQPQDRGAVARISRRRPIPIAAMRSRSSPAR